MQLTFKPRGLLNTRAGKKPAAVADVESLSDGITSDSNLSSERYNADKADSEIEPSSSEPESEPSLDKKASVRKPSKRALENAANEVSDW